jgi:hypothetical protein
LQRYIEAGESVLLYPGGAREVAKRRGEAGGAVHALTPPDP